MIIYPEVDLSILSFTIGIGTIKQVVGFEINNNNSPVSIGRINY
jgi:hypothetical protein